MPPTPKALTPARRGPDERFQSDRRVLTKKGESAKSIAGLGLSKWRLGGIRPVRTASAALIRPVTPEAMSRWPTFGLTDPIAQKPFAAVAERKARVRPAISIGSPRGVPVPCVST